MAGSERARCARSIRILGGIESIATTADLACPGRLPNDRCGRRDLLVVARLELWLAEGWIGLHRRRRRDTRLGDIGLGDIGLGDRRLTGGGALRASLKQPQALFQLAIAVLQFLILPGELAQLILQLLDSHFWVSSVGLR